MRYPLLSEYMEAIRTAEDSFNQLSDLRPVLNGKGDPMMAIGSVRTISDRVFAYCKSLQSISIPNSVTAIGEGTFSNCISLQSVNIHKAVTYIGNSAFSWCKSLESIHIPNGVTTIGEGAFMGCDAL